MNKTYGLTSNTCTTTIAHMQTKYRKTYEQEEKTVTNQKRQKHETHEDYNEAPYIHRRTRTSHKARQTREKLIMIQFKRVSWILDHLVIRPRIRNVL